MPVKLFIALVAAPPIAAAAPEHPEESWTKRGSREVPVARRSKPGLTTTVATVPIFHSQARPYRRQTFNCYSSSLRPTSLRRPTPNFREHDHERATREYRLLHKGLRHELRITTNWLPNRAARQIGATKGSPSNGPGIIEEMRHADKLVRADHSLDGFPNMQVL